jgi:hypothetical protein
MIEALNVFPWWQLRTRSSSGKPAGYELTIRTADGAYRTVTRSTVETVIRFAVTCHGSTSKTEDKL